MDKPTANLLQMMRDRVNSLREQGNLEEALHAASALVDKCQHALGPDLAKIDAFVSSLEARAGIYMELGQFDEALEDGKQAIDQLDSRPDRFGALGRLYTLVGTAYDSIGKHDRMVSAWESAMSFFEKREPPLLLDVAAVANNLGFAAKASGDLDGAEDYFLKSLQIMHSELGAKDPETASVSNNLGAVYLAAGYYEQAREMHMMALEARRENFGENHEDTAQSHNNLALALLETGDRTWARKHFERALSAFEALGSNHVDDLESVASNYCEFLCAEGEENLAKVIEKRVKESLQSS